MIHICHRPLLLLLLGCFLRQAGLFAAKACAERSRRAAPNTHVKGTLPFIISRDLFAV